MKHNKIKIVRIIEELLNAIYHIGGKDIDVRVREDDEMFCIILHSNFNLSQKEFLFKLCQHLDIERNRQMEAYYWELAGESEANELSLVGMMIDEYFLNVNEDQLELTLIRKK